MSFSPDSWILSIQATNEHHSSRIIVSIIEVPRPPRVPSSLRAAAATPPAPLLPSPSLPRVASPPSDDRRYSLVVLPRHPPQLLLPAAVGRSCRTTPRRRWRRWNLLSLHVLVPWLGLGGVTAVLFGGLRFRTASGGSGWPEQDGAASWWRGRGRRGAVLARHPRPRSGPSGPHLGFRRAGSNPRRCCLLHIGEGGWLGRGAAAPTACFL